MEEQEIEKSFRKKKKFVYLDKYETYKTHTDDRIRLIQKSINMNYILIGLLAIGLLTIILAK
jgi:hypothetical protein